MTLPQIVAIACARWRIFLLGFVLIAGSILGFSLLQSRTYTATTSLLIDAHSSDTVTGSNLAAQLIASYLATQSDIITSKNVAFKVIDQTRLTKNPMLQEKFSRQAGHTEVFRDWLADHLIKAVRTEPSRESSIVGISVDAETPQLAAMLANAFAQAYIRTNLELRVEPARQNLIWFDQQSRSLRDTLEVAQGRLSAYQQENGILATDERENLENLQLAEISSQLTKADAEVSELASKRSQAKALQARGGNLAMLPEVAASPAIQALKAELSRMEDKKSELAARTGRNHPQYLRASAEVDAVRMRLQAEAASIIGGETASVQVTRQRAASLQQALEAKKGAALRAKKQRNELAVLSREVENARQGYDGAMQKASQARLQSQVSQTNVMVLNPATAPQRQSKPNLALRAAAALLLGFLAGMAAVFVAEALDARVRSEADLQLLAAIPVLAVFGQRRSRAGWLTRLRHVSGRRNGSDTLPAGRSA